MSVASDAPILIVGAGPTGLVLALWLVRQGINSRIIDKAPSPSTTSRALGVHARTLELYRQLDLARAVMDGGARVTAVNLWVQGHRAARLPVGDMGRGRSPFPFVLMYPQDEHERLLTARLADSGIQVERGTELLRLAQRPESMRATVRRAGTQEDIEVRYVAGCDGAHSAVRSSLAVDFPGGTYTRTFYVADVQATGPAADHELHVDLDESDLLAVFPMPGDGRVRLVGTVQEGAGQGRDGPTIDDVGQRALQQLRLEITRVNWFSTYRVHHRVAAHFRSGHVFLLGDAAHIHSPVGAQGMNTGIGDGINLAWKLAAVLQGGAPEALLDTYEPERIAFARRLVATTDRVFSLASSTRPAAEWIRTHVVPYTAAALGRLMPMQRLLFRTISQIAIHYRQSPLSEGRAGKVHGGDRLPWVGTVGTNPYGGDNFDSLGSRRWLVHVYGKASPELRASCAALALPLCDFPWTSAAAHAGLARDALYLVRPDGYVGLASAQATPGAVQGYCARHRIGAVPDAGAARLVSATRR